MKFLLSVKTNTPDAPIDPHFGRAPWFVISGTDDEALNFVENEGAKQSSGAGVAAAQCAVDQKVEAVVSGRFGPHAAQVIAAAGIKMFLLDETCRSIADVKNAMVNGTLQEQES